MPLLLDRADMALALIEEGFQRPENWLVPLAETKGSHPAPSTDESVART
jgi:hypothetical protein